MFNLVEKGICPLCGKNLEDTVFGFNCITPANDTIGQLSHFRIFNIVPPIDYDFCVGNLKIDISTNKALFHIFDYTEVEEYEITYFDFSSEDEFIKKLEMIKVFS